jgi:hypothetical protein
VYGHKQWRPDRDPIHALGSLTLDDTHLGESGGFGMLEGVQF